jgi:succinyl-CoA:acetate CoA-transferase
MFLSPSTAKNGAISCIVPMVSHVDHTEHDVPSSSPSRASPTCAAYRRGAGAQQVIDHCAHPD